MKYFIVMLALVFCVTTVDARPDKGGKPRKERVSKEELKKRWEAAKKKRDAKRGDAKKKGHKHKGPRGEFGKVVRNDEKIKELKKEFAKVADKIKGKFDRKKFKDATDEEKAALRDKMRASRKEWEAAMKTHRIEVGKRMKEIREEFKNNRDKIIDGNKPGE